MNVVIATRGDSSIRAIQHESIYNPNDNTISVEIISKLDHKTYDDYNALIKMLEDNGWKKNPIGDDLWYKHLTTSVEL